MGFDLGIPREVVGGSFLCFNGAFRQDVGTHVGVKSGSKPGF